MKKRLFLCNGPTQVLNVLTIIEESKYQDKYIDILCIHSTFVKSDLQHPISKAILNLASLHSWEKVIYLDSNYNFSYTEEFWYNLFGVDELHEIFVVRNHGFINSITINLYSNAKIIVYGDSLGIFDSIIIDESFSNVRIDEVRLIIPMFSTTRLPVILNKLSIHIIPIEYLKEVIKKVANNLKELESLDYSLEYNFYLTSYFSQLGWSSFEEEIAIYSSHIEQMYSKSDVIYLKPHPRDHTKIADTLYLDLKDKNYNVFFLKSELQGYPLEIFPEILKVNTISMAASTANIGIKVLYPDIALNSINTEEVKINSELKYVLDNNLLYAITELPKDNYLVNTTNTFQERYERHSMKVDKILKEFYQKYNLNKRDVYFYGSGSYLYEHQFVEKINKLGVKLLKGILDSSKEKEGTPFFEYKVYHRSIIEKFIIENKKPYILITSSYYEEIANYLMSIGLVENEDYFNLYFSIHRIN